MGTPSDHPATSLPEDERIEYVRIIASIAFIDGKSAPAEVSKLMRLADVLKIPESAVEGILNSLRSTQDIAASKAQVPWFRDNAKMRTSLMMDSIVIAFSDGKLEPSETRQLSTFADILGFSQEEVVKIARFVEKTLFKRNDDEHQALARELGAAFGAAHESHGFFGWVKGVLGD